MSRRGRDAYRSDPRYVEKPWPFAGIRAGGKRLAVPMRHVCIRAGGKRLAVPMRHVSPATLSGRQGTASALSELRKENRKRRMRLRKRRGRACAG